MLGFKSIVACGGWVVRESVGRPKMQFFACVAALWSVVAVLGAMMAWTGSVDGVPDETARLSLWMVLPEPVLIVLALWFAFTEAPRKILHRIPKGHRGI